MRRSFPQEKRSRGLGRHWKAFALVVCAAFALSVQGCSQTGGEQRAHASGTTHQGVGVVVAIDAAKGRVKIKHEEIKGYMDAMTMWFRVKDKAMLESIAPNDPVEFTITEEDAGDVLTELKKRT